MMDQFWTWWWKFIAAIEARFSVSTPSSAGKASPPIQPVLVMASVGIANAIGLSVPSVLKPAGDPLLPTRPTAPAPTTGPSPGPVPGVTSGSTVTGSIPGSTSTNATSTSATSTGMISAGPTIAIMNFSSVLSDTEVRAAIAALQVQIDRDFRPLWGLSANLLFVPSIKRPPINAWVVQMLDTSDVGGALGYHDMTNIGLPVGKVFAKDDKKYGLSWTITLSHEVLEMLGDPYIDTTVFVQDSNTTGMMFAYELCDAVEDDGLGYVINGVRVSNFVTPAYFEAGRLPGSTKFDFRNALTAPLTLAGGGYMSVFAVNPKTTGWSQLTDAKGVAPRLTMKLARHETRINRRARPPAHHGA